MPKALVEFKKENELLAAIIKKPSSIVELKEQVVSSKREILMFESNTEELGIKHKQMLNSEHMGCLSQNDLPITPGHPNLQTIFCD